MTSNIYHVRDQSRWHSELSKVMNEQKARQWFIFASKSWEISKRIIQSNEMNRQRDILFICANKSWEMSGEGFSRLFCEERVGCWIMKGSGRSHVIYTHQINTNHYLEYWGNCQNRVSMSTIIMHSCRKSWSWRWHFYQKNNSFPMMTSSNGNIFRVTGHLCGEFTGPRWIPHTKASDAELWCFFWSASESTVE